MKPQSKILHYLTLKRQPGKWLLISGSVVLWLCTVLLLIDAVICFDRHLIPWEFYQRLEYTTGAGLPLGALAIALSLWGRPKMWQATLLLIVGILTLVATILTPSFAHG